MKMNQISLYLAGIVLTVVFFALDLSLELGVAGGLPYIAVVLLGLWSRQKNYLLAASLTGSVLTILGFFLSPAGGEVWKVLLNRSLALLAIWVTAILCFFYKRKEEALWKSQRELESLLDEKNLALKATSEKLIRNISEHRLTEENLHESEMHIHSILDNTVDAIITIDEKGIVKSFNIAAEKIFDYSSSEVIGQNISMLMPTPDRDEHDQYIQNYISTGEAKIIGIGREVAGLSKDGNLISLELAISPIVLGEERRFIGIMRDITERKIAEQNLNNSRQEFRDLYHRLQTAREDERTRIAREIHDELGQMLTAIKIDLCWLKKKLPKDQEVFSDKMLSMSKFLDSTIEDVRRISSDLRPEVLDLLGLDEAIGWQAEEFQNRTGIRCNLNINLKDIKLEPNCSTTFFRIFQEALTNVARYADASEVDINLIRDNGNLTLTVKDNGIGITENQISNSKSLGLIGIRERVNLFNGKFIIQGSQGKGTSLFISIPLEICEEK